MSGQLFKFMSTLVGFYEYISGFMSTLVGGCCIYEYMNGHFLVYEYISGI